MLTYTSLLTLLLIYMLIYIYYIIIYVSPAEVLTGVEEDTSVLCFLSGSRKVKSGVSIFPYSLKSLSPWQKVHNTDGPLESMENGN